MILQDDEFFTLPQSVPLEQVIQFRDQLQQLCSHKQQSSKLSTGLFYMEMIIVNT